MIVITCLPRLMVSVLVGSVDSEAVYLWMMIELVKHERLLLVFAVHEEVVMIVL